MKLLLLLFFNNNTYSINYESISLIANEICAQEYFIEELEQIVFIIDKEEKEKFDKLIRLYRQFRILVETSEVWLNQDYESPHYQYNSIILYFADKIKKMIKTLIPSMRDEHINIFDCICGLEKEISYEKQIILNNMGFAEEILEFFQNYKHFLNKITK